MTVLSRPELEAICGGGDLSAFEGPAFGRCGPGDRWKWLGNNYTDRCLRHDAAVRDALASGSSLAMAHVKASPLLPGAILSEIAAGSKQVADQVYSPGSTS